VDGVKNEEEEEEERLLNMRARVTKAVVKLLAVWQSCCRLTSCGTTTSLMVTARIRCTLV